MISRFLKPLLVAGLALTMAIPASAQSLIRDAEIETTLRESTCTPAC